MSNDVDEFQALQSVITALQPFESTDRARILKSAALFLQIPASEPEGAWSSSLTGGRELAPSPTADAHRSSYPAFSTPDDTSPKDFLFDKQPRTDVERIAVLAFYLTHYRDTPHFKTLDLTKLNTEAAQPKFANAANSAGNAVKQGYLVPSNKGLRQLSAAGERFVAALPDREMARATMVSNRPKRRQPRKSTSSVPAGDSGSNS
jgi:hypothetical protein